MLKKGIDLDLEREGAFRARWRRETALFFALRALQLALAVSLFSIAAMILGGMYFWYLVNIEKAYAYTGSITLEIFVASLFVFTVLSFGLAMAQVRIAVLRRDTIDQAIAAQFPDLPKVNLPKDVRLTLYLRSFIDDDRLKREQDDTFISGVSAIGEATHFTWMQRALWRFGPVVRIGDRRAFTLDGGALKISDSEWFEVFKQLATRAETIFLSPIVSTRSGTYEEIEYIRKSQLENKTLIMMPGRRSARYLFWKRESAEKVSAIDRWVSARVYAFASFFGFVAPEVRSEIVPDPWPAIDKLVRDEIGFSLPAPDRVPTLGIPYRGRYRTVRGLSGQPWDNIYCLRRLIEYGDLRRALWFESLVYSVKFFYKRLPILLFAGVMIGGAVAPKNPDAPLWGSVLLFCIGLSGILMTLIYSWNTSTRFALRRGGASLLFLGTYASGVATLFFVGYIAQKIVEIDVNGAEGEMPGWLAFSLVLSIWVSLVWVWTFLVLGVFHYPRRWRSVLH